MPARRCPWCPTLHPMLAGTCVCTWTGVLSRYRACTSRAASGDGRSLSSETSLRDNTHAVGPGGDPWGTGTRPARART
eukprot:4289704-Alexandrium_andersonii.AAC.1